MKKAILLIVVLFSISSFQKAYSQSNVSLTFVKATNCPNLEDIFTSNPKLSLYKNGNIEIYNEDFSLYKSFKATDILIDATDFVDIRERGKEVVSTQTLFNDDKLLEFIVFGNDFFAIVNENGKELFRETISGAKFGQSEAEIYVIASKVYLAMYMGTTADNAASYRFYEITKNTTSGMSQTSVLKKQPYPNPAKSIINLPFNLVSGQQAAMRIYDINGKQITTKHIDSTYNKVSLDVSGYEKGMYLYEYNGISSKFLVE